MTDLRTIETKHKAIDAEIFRRGVEHLDKDGISLEAKQVLLWAITQSWLVDAAFRDRKVVALRPEPPAA